MKILMITWVCCIIFALNYAADTISKNNNYVKARPVGFDAKMKSSLAKSQQCLAEASMETPHSILCELKEEILYIGEGFLDAESTEEMVEHASEVFERHKGLILGGLGLSLAARTIMSPSKQPVNLAKNSASSMRAEEIRKWGTRKL